MKNILTCGYNSQCSAVLKRYSRVQVQIMYLQKCRQTRYFQTTPHPTKKIWRILIFFDPNEVYVIEANIYYNLFFRKYGSFFG